jgi:glycosyltransferase involved in cell wall biosynthesis
MKRLEILVTSLPDLNKIPVQRYHHLLSFLSKSHNITVLGVNAWWLEKREDGYRDECLRGIKFSYITEKKINPVIQEIGILQKIRNLTGFDVHINFNSLVAGYLVARKTRIPTVFDVCDDLPQRISISSQVPAIFRPLGKAVGRLMLESNIKRAKRITYVTKSLGNSYHFPQTRSTLIPNGVRTDLFYSRPPEPIREKLGLGGSFVVGFVGVLGEWVQLEPALAAIRQITEREPKIKLLIVGDGNGFQRIKNLIRQYRIPEKVILTGHVPYSRVPEYISGMDCCLISLKPTADCQNAFPLTLLEYMACEKPVITTALAGVKEAVGERVLYASSAEELKQNILTLYQDEEMGKKLGREGRIFVTRKYSWENIGRQFEEVILKAAVNPD